MVQARAFYRSVSNRKLHSAKNNNPQADEMYLYCLATGSNNAVGMPNICRISSGSVPIHFNIVSPFSAKSNRHLVSSEALWTQCRYSLSALWAEPIFSKCCDRYWGWPDSVFFKYTMACLIKHESLAMSTETLWILEAKHQTTCIEIDGPLCISLCLKKAIIRFEFKSRSNA